MLLVDFVIRWTWKKKKRRSTHWERLERMHRPLEYSSFIWNFFIMLMLHVWSALIIHFSLLGSIYFQKCWGEAREWWSVIGWCSLSFLNICAIVFWFNCLRVTDNIFFIWLHLLKYFLLTNSVSWSVWLVRQSAPIVSEQKWLVFIIISCHRNWDLL